MDLSGVYRNLFWIVGGPRDVDGFRCLRSFSLRLYFSKVFYYVSLPVFNDPLQNFLIFIRTYFSSAFSFVIYSNE